MAVGLSSLSDSVSAVRVACAHCGLPVPSNRVRLDHDTSFCCAGCEAVWGILHESGLTEYYHLRDAYGEKSPGPARVSGKSFDFLDDPQFLKTFSLPRAQGGVRVEFYLEGVHCIACNWLVEKILTEREGARFARLDLSKSVLEVIFNPAEVKLSTLASALDSFGYPPHVLAEDGAALARRKETRRLLARTGVAAACGMNIMLLAISQYGGNATGMDAQISSVFRWVSLGLALPAVLYSAFPYYRGAWNGLRRRMLHMDLPISLGIASAFAVSAIATIQNRGDVYFDSVCMLIALLLAGRLLLQRATRWAGNSAEQLLALSPRSVHVIVESQIRDALLTDIAVGDALRVWPGETVPVDGVLHSESAWIREAHLTGEAMARQCAQGDTLFAGSVVETTPVDIVASAVGETTRLSRLAAMMREASSRRAPIVSLMDRVAGYFVAGVLVLAAATAVIWFFVDPTRVLWNTAALLVVACPCALGLATPVAIAAAMGRAARRGIFIKGQDGVERLASVEHVILDKTGTLTDGKLAIVDSWFAKAIEKECVLRAVAAVEKYSGHAAASAFSFMETAGLVVEDYRVLTGAGVEGMVNGARYAIGSEVFAMERVAMVSDDARAYSENAVEQGWSVVWVVKDGEIAAIFALGDRIRPDSAEAINRIGQMGLCSELLSGDQPRAVAQVAANLGIKQATGRVTPEGKLARVESLIAAGKKVAMVGDGVNDAAALTCATIGISVAGAAEVTRDAADVFVAFERGPGAIADALQLSRHAMRVIRINLLIALAYNLFGAALAISGHVSPLLAAVLMPISSLTVLLVASRA